MNYTAKLDTGEKLTLGNQNGHTQIALASDENGHSQAQNTAFPIGDWSQKPQLWGIGIGFVVQIATGDGEKWVSIDQNGIHLLDKTPDLQDAKALELQESEAEIIEALAPMKPMKPMGS